MTILKMIVFAFLVTTILLEVVVVAGGYFMGLRANKGLLAFALVRICLLVLTMYVVANEA